ncbi:hypothetical protein EGW08_011780 [Elysia chlorotica]|uniref:Myb-like domain-containing protein n=1 Tax=Elysia chlorotica TaxID=188477 RepID=A0A433TFZ3_ELYCH|nr:hypothetical protein EGW08_011780 [Elysia chlorotica]
MSGRRPRLVIKPNIRPGVSKTAPGSKPKPAVPVTEITTPAKSLQVPVPNNTEKVISKEDEVGDENLKISVQTEGISSRETIEDVSSRAGIAEAISNGPQCEIETEIQIIGQNETPTPRANSEGHVTQHSVPPAESVPRFKSPQAAAPQPAAISVSEASSVATRNTDDTLCLKKPEDVCEAEGRELDEPQEVDDCEGSVTSSLEADHECRTEVEEASGKKPRRHRSRKPKLEALPSREKSPDRQKMKMSDLLLWNPERNFLPSKPKKKKNVKDENRPTSPDESLSVEDKADATKETENAALPAPQVMIGPDGNVVLNTESLLISTPEKGSHSRSKIIVEEDDDDRYLNTNSYRKCYKKKFWSDEETDKFFMGLSMCGTDFSLLTKLLTNRSRRELKNKFRREEKFNRPRVDKSLSNMRQYDPSVFVEKPPAPPKPKVKKQAGLAKKVKVSTDATTAKASDSALKVLKPPAKKENPPPRKTKKRKRQESSEDEEDDWGPKYDEIDEEEEIASRLPAYTRKSNRKASNGVAWNKEDGGEEGESIQPSLVAIADSGPNKSPSAQTGTVPLKALPPAPTGIAPTVARPPTGIAPIPGTTQVQIEVSGVQTPVQGMLIPSHLVPSLAPQLGLGEGALGGRAQVLLVHEESADGSLVHVYIIPEEDSASATPATSHVGKTSGNLSGNTSGNISGGQRQAQHPLQHQGVSKVLPKGITSPSSSVHFSNVCPQQRPSVQPLSANAPRPGTSVSAHPPFRPSSPADVRTQPQFSPSGGVRASSAFPPWAGVKSPSPFPPVAGVKSPSPFPPVAGVKSPAPFPPAGCSPNQSSGGVKSPAPFPPSSRASSTSPFPPSPAGVRCQSPFPPTLTGRRNSPFPGAAQSPVDASSFPMSPPPIQAHRPQRTMPRPQPQTQHAHNLTRNNSIHSMVSVVTGPRNAQSSIPASSDPPIQNLMAVVEAAEPDKSDFGFTDKSRLAPNDSQQHPMETDSLHQPLPSTIRTDVLKKFHSKTGLDKNAAGTVSASTGSGDSLAEALGDAQEVLLVPDKDGDESRDFVTVGHVIHGKNQTLEQQQNQGH